MHLFEVRVRYGDTDQMGFAYYAHYLRWFEIGRAEMMRTAGWSYRDIEAAGISLPVLEAHCRYSKPACYDDRIAIETGVLELGRASVRFGYRISRVEPAARLAVGWTAHCFIDPNGRPVRPPRRLVAMLEQAPPAALETDGPPGTR